MQDDGAGGAAERIARTPPRSAREEGADVADARPLPSVGYSTTITWTSSTNPVLSPSTVVATIEITCSPAATVNASVW